MGVVHWLGVVLAFCAMGLLVIVSVSAPIWNSVYFLKAAVNNTRLGNWGYCMASGCSKTMYGYKAAEVFGMNSNLVNGNNVNFGGLGNFADNKLTYALILHPIAAGVAAIAVLFGLFPFLPCGILGSIVAFFAFLISAVALIIDLVLFIRLRNDLRRAGTAASLGNAIWMVVAATAALLIASLFICFTRSSRHRDRKSDDVYAAETAEPRRRGFLGFGGRRHAQDPYVADGTTEPVMTEKRHFWQRNRAAPATTATY